MSIFAIGLCVICGALILESRRTAFNHAAEVAESLTKAIEADIFRTVTSYDLSLKAVVDNLKHPDIGRINADLRHLVLFDRSASSPHLESIALLDENGDVRLDSRRIDPAPSNRALRDYFQFHKTNSSLKLHVSAPLVARTSGSELIAISRRLSHSDGSFAGVIAGSLRLSYFKDLFKNVTLGPGGNITLSRTDGIVLMRWPYEKKYLGLDIKSAELFQQLAHARSGHFETVAKTDGVHRLFAYSQVGNLPLVIAVGQATADIYAKWSEFASALALLVALLLAITVSLTYYLVRELKSHSRAQADLDTATTHMSQGLCMFDRNRRLVTSNEKYIQMYGLPPDLVKPGIHLRDLLQLRKEAGSFDWDVDSYIDDLVSQLASGRDVQTTSTLSDGRTIFVANCPREDGGWVATHDDISDRKRAENELATVKNFLDSIVENIPLPVGVKDPQTRKFVLVNRAYAAFIGVPREQIVGTTVFSLFREDVAAMITKYDIDALQRHDIAVSAEFPLDTKSNGERIVSTTRIVVRDSKSVPQYLIVVIEDITERKSTEAEIARLAHYDSLTGLANRVLFRENVNACLAKLRRAHAEFAVFLLDLDKFKAVNDTLGHQVGDALLKEVGGRIKSAIREVDVAARLGGDEFALIVQPGEDSLKEGSIRLATRLLDVISAPYDILGHKVMIGTSIGIAMAPADSMDADELLKFADLAMYKAKTEGRNDYRMYSPQMDLEVQARHRLELDLRRALSEGQFELLYQPVIDIPTGEAICAEAVVRWRHPERGVLKPEEFVSIAEDTGLIVPLGEWILRTACAEAMKWPPHIKVAVNLSAVQCKKGDLVDVVIFALAESGLSPDRLELEITESVLLDGSAASIAVFHHLRELGTGIVMDDFGTGFSSLLYLQQFPFDKVKIDQSFVRDLVRNRNSAAIVCAVNALAKGLGIVTVAQGIETQEQFDLLRLAGCDQAQGFHFSQPVPPSDLKFIRYLKPDAAASAA